MRSQAVALPGGIDPSEVANEVARRVASGNMTLDELAEIADRSIGWQNAFTKARIYAERQIAQQYLFDGSDYQHNVAQLRSRGWSASRIASAKRCMQLQLDDVDSFIASHTENDREATSAAARALIPVKRTDERKGMAFAYSAPPIDVELAREFGLDASDVRTDQIMSSVQRALDTMENPRHAYVWSRHHGINDDGTIGERWTFQGIAASMEGGAVSREYVGMLYSRASVHVYKTIAVDALNALQKVMAAA